MGVLMPITRGLVPWPAGLALASVAPRAGMPHGNVGDGRLDVQGSSPGPPGPGTTPARHHAPTATRVVSHEGACSCPPSRHPPPGATFLSP
jgi:hypothetical protein